MNIQERIHNIKTLLKYCPKSTKDVEIVKEDVGLFFADLFNTDDRFQHTPYDRVYPKIYLSKQLKNDYSTQGTCVAIEYVCDNDRDGEYTAGYFFDDDDIKDTFFYDDLRKSGTLIKYSEVPDSIWETIQGVLYKKAESYIHSELNSCLKEVEFWKGTLNEFTNELKLNS